MATEASTISKKNEPQIRSRRRYHWNSGSSFARGEQLRMRGDHQHQQDQRYLSKGKGKGESSLDNDNDDRDPGIGDASNETIITIPDGSGTNETTIVPTTNITSSPVVVITPTPSPVVVDDDSTIAPTLAPVIATTPSPINSMVTPTPVDETSSTTQPIPSTTTAVCTDLVSSSSSSYEVFDFRYWVELIPTDVDGSTTTPTTCQREITVLQLESALLIPMADTLLVCSNEENSDLGIVALDYTPLDTLAVQQDECPAELENCFVYVGYMGITIEDGKDMDVAIQAARTTLKVLMEASNANDDFIVSVLGVNGLNDVEYLGPPYFDATNNGNDGVNAATGTGGGTTLSASNSGDGDGLSVAGIVLIAFVAFAAFIAAIMSISYRRGGGYGIDSDDEGSPSVHEEVTKDDGLMLDTPPPEEEEVLEEDAPEATADKEIAATTTTYGNNTQPDTIAASGTITGTTTSPDDLISQLANFGEGTDVVADTSELPPPSALTKQNSQTLMSGNISATGYIL